VPPMSNPTQAFTMCSPSPLGSRTLSDPERRDSEARREIGRVVHVDPRTIMMELANAQPRCDGSLDESREAETKLFRRSRVNRFRLEDVGPGGYSPTLHRLFQVIDDGPVRDRATTSPS
jgi:hypothetical protein